MNEEASRPAYFVVIPPQVRYDTGLPPFAKLLCGEIASLMGRFGTCSHNNGEIARLYGVAPSTVGRAIAVLKKRGYITVEVVRDRQTHVVLGRKIHMTQAGGFRGGNM